MMVSKCLTHSSAMFLSIVKYIELIVAVTCIAFFLSSCSIYTIPHNTLLTNGHQENATIPLANYPLFILTSGTYVTFVVIIVGMIVGDLTNRSLNLVLDVLWTTVGGILFILTGCLLFHSKKTFQTEPSVTLSATTHKVDDSLGFIDRYSLNALLGDYMVAEVSSYLAIGCGCLMVLDVINEMLP